MGSPQRQALLRKSCSSGVGPPGCRGGRGWVGRGQTRWPTRICVVPDLRRHVPKPGCAATAGPGIAPDRPKIPSRAASLPHVLLLFSHATRAVGCPGLEVMRPMRSAAPLPTHVWPDMSITSSLRSRAGAPAGQWWLRRAAKGKGLWGGGGSGGCGMHRGAIVGSRQRVASKGARAVKTQRRTPKPPNRQTAITNLPARKLKRLHES